MDEIIGYLILCPLAFLIGYLLRDDMEVDRYNREKPLENEIMRYRLQEAYREGQRNPEPGMYFDAPVPPIHADEMPEQVMMNNFRCKVEPLFPKQAENQLKSRGWILGKRINGVRSGR